MKDSFILYTEQKAVIDKLTDEQAGKLIKAIYQYAKDGTMPELDMLLEIAFIPIKQNLERNSEKWEDIKQKRSNAGKLGAEIKKQKQANQANANFALSKQANEAVNVNVNVNGNVNVNDNENREYEGKKQTNVADTLSEAEASESDDMSSLKSQKSEKKNDTAKASKHKYGEYKNVLLKDEELQALQKDFANWGELIKYLDEYIEMKGYQAKSHYLCIRKWVVKAVKEEQLKAKKENSSTSNSYHSDTTEQYGDLSKFYAN